MAKIMIQGTGSSVGKSILCTALCRIFKQDGYAVVPYKSQNMSLNSYITLDGKEMGRAQVLQAFAAELQPQAYMNPILLKPSEDTKAQVILHGEVYGNFSAKEYDAMKPKFKEMLEKDFSKMEKNFDIVVIEGAGSPAEINLRENDIVNMGLAELVDAPVLLVGDIDKGGVFASLAGTMLLLEEREKQRVKGTIINKFRGDIDILKPGIDMIEDIIKIPCMGVVPYFRLELEEEDGASYINKSVMADIDIAVIKLPHISNFTDMDAFVLDDDVSVRYIEKVSEFGEPDLLIIPGSKNTISDLEAIKKVGLDERIISFANSKGRIIGICGGYQILGKKIRDPFNVESSSNEIKGLSLIDVETVIERDKIMTRVEGILSEDALGKITLENYRSETNNKIEANDKKGVKRTTYEIEINNKYKQVEKNHIYGYEIHMGKTEYLNERATYFAKVLMKNGEKEEYRDGYVNEEGNIIGTYLHGIFDSINFREILLNKIRTEKGLTTKKSRNYEEFRDRELDKLADIVRKSLDMEKIYKIMFEW